MVAFPYEYVTCYQFFVIETISMLSGGFRAPQANVQTSHKMSVILGWAKQPQWIGKAFLEGLAMGKFGESEVGEIPRTGTKYAGGLPFLEILRIWSRKTGHRNILKIIYSKNCSEIFRSD